MAYSKSHLIFEDKEFIILKYIIEMSTILKNNNDINISYLFVQGYYGNPIFSLFNILVNT